MTKNIYHFHKETKELLEVTAARIDPEETRISLEAALEQKKNDALAADPDITQEALDAIVLTEAEKDACNVYLIPINATDVEPPVAEVNKADIYDEVNNVWNKVDDYRGQTVYDQGTGESLEITELGAIPYTHALTKPQSVIVEHDIAVAKNALNDDIEAQPSQSVFNSMSIAQLKEFKRHEVTVRFKHAMGWILNSYLPEEIDSWSEQKKDADKWGEYRAANPSMTDSDLQSYNETPMLKELAKGKTGKDDLTLTVADVDDYQSSILSKSGFFRPYSGGLVGIKKRLLKTIDDQLEDFSGEADPVAAEQAARDTLTTLDTTEILAAGYAYIVANS